MIANKEDVATDIFSLKHKQLRSGFEPKSLITINNDDNCRQGHMSQWIKSLDRSSDIPKKSVSSIPGEGKGELPEGTLTGDNWLLTPFKPNDDNRYVKCVSST